MTQVIATSGRAIVTLKKPEALSEGGLIIPEQFRKKSVEAIVVSSNVPDVDTGDTVLLSGEYAGALFTINKVDYISVVPEEILAVL